MCSDGGTSHSTDEALLIGVEFCALRDAGQRISFALQQRALRRHGVRRSPACRILTSRSMQRATCRIVCSMHVA